MHKEPIPMKMRLEGCMLIWVMSVQIQMDIEKTRKKACTGGDHKTFTKGCPKL